MGKKFKEKRTISGIFINSDKTQSKVHMMNQEYNNILYYEDRKVQMLSLPYISNYLDFQMIIILPNSTIYSSPLDYLINENIQINNLYSKLKSKQNINLYLPKFNFAFNSDLNVLLENLGIISIFDKIMLQNFFNINENGTYSDGVEIDYASPLILNKRDMVVNHSFIFLIKSDKIKDIDGNNIMPYIGVINNLEKIKDDDSNEDKPIKTSNDDSSNNSPYNPNDPSTLRDYDDENDDYNYDEPIKINTYQMNLKLNLEFIIILIILFCY